MIYAFDIKSGSSYRPVMQRFWGGLVILSALAGGAVAGAQAGGAGNSAAVTALAAEDTLEQPSKIPLPEKKARAESMVADMRAAYRRATEILGEANANKDVVQLNCIQEKLTQIGGLVDIADGSSKQMLKAAGQNRDDAVNHEFTKLAVAHQKTMQLRAEADQCVGEKAIYTGDTVVETEIDPNLTESDPTDVPMDGVFPETPEVASRY
jgi:hypothetical protein